MHRLVEPPVLFTAMALMVLAAIWSSAFVLAEREQQRAQRLAAALALELTDTYEAQMVRALREIDHTLKLLRYSLRHAPAATVLDTLRARDMLPPRLLFAISVVGPGGAVLARTHEEMDFAAVWAAEPAPGEDALHVGLPRRDPYAGEWRITFSRRLDGPILEPAGFVAVQVPAGYFVSGYSHEALGELGVLGLVGPDGVFRVIRSGEAITAATTVDYATLVPDDPQASGPPLAQVSSWDGVRRYTVARALYDFPLAIVVGLAETEQLATAVTLRRSYLWRAALASALVLTVLGALYALSRQLQRTRLNAVAERMEHARRVEHLAYHDSLTALPNRVLFSRLLAQGIEQARRYERQMGLLFLDLDRFKPINDSLGHDAGDQLLQEVGQRLRNSVRDSDVVARLGGDEFVILLPEVSDRAQVAAVATKILAAVGEPYCLIGHDVGVTVSIGLTLFPEDGMDEQTLMKNADTAMYHAKGEGKNTCKAYSDRLDVDSLERLTLEFDLRHALERDEFRLHYQAKQDLDSGQIRGMEALLRWQHPSRGLLAPLEFIPLAEQSGLIVPIGRWVLHRACQQNVAWQGEGVPPLNMAVNLSARQFLDDALLDDVRDALQSSGMAPQLLELEITETMAMHDVARTVRILTELKQLGVRITVDDFGTGYSSLSTLKALPFDTIKLDRSFIDDVVGSASDQGLTEAVIALGKCLSLTVIAAGVESAAQAEFLRSRGCDQYQGFYFHRPMPADEAFSYLQAPDPATPHWPIGASSRVAPR